MKKPLAIALLLAAAAAHAADTPWIGIELDRGTHGGSKVKAVLTGTPGERAGLHAGDEVLFVDDVKADSPKKLIEAVQVAGVGHVAKLKVVDAGGKTRTVALTLEARPSSEALQRSTLVGKTAPDFEPSVKAGPKVGKLSSLRGQVVLIDFFATWCGPCIASMPHVEELHQKLAAQGLRVIGVSTESPEIVASAAGRFHVTYPLASDESEAVSRSYQVFALPTAVVIDRHGVVREVAVADTDAIDAAVAAALKAK